MGEGGDANADASAPAAIVFFVVLNPVLGPTSAENDVVARHEFEIFHTWALGRSAAIGHRDFLTSLRRVDPFQAGGIDQNAACDAR